MVGYLRILEVLLEALEVLPESLEVLLEALEGSAVYSWPKP
jgi:hypothetical protein